jgi:hypothetical protein
MGFNWTTILKKILLSILISGGRTIRIILLYSLRISNFISSFLNLLEERFIQILFLKIFCTNLEERYLLEQINSRKTTLIEKKMLNKSRQIINQ